MQNPRREPSADPHANALTEAVNRLYKTELIHRHGPQKTTEQIELATLEYVRWWNKTRPRQRLGHHIPTKAETTYYPGRKSTQPALAEQETKQERNPRRFSHTPARSDPPEPPWSRRGSTRRCQDSTVN
ncbi:IS3 family transposase [Arachnia propionica]|uniref:IS3 family transposase n=1 Tax=Arachnia propionica TaxID=1750 RepID=UPI00399C8BF1